MFEEWTRRDDTSVCGKARNRRGTRFGDGGFFHLYRITLGTDALGVYVTPGIFSATAMVFVDVLIFLILWD